MPIRCSLICLKSFLIANSTQVFSISFRVKLPYWLFSLSPKRLRFGPLRIKNELIQRGVQENLFYSLDATTDWSYYALEALKKKMNGKMPEETKDILKLKSFLNYRGFEFQDIDKAFDLLSKEN